MSAPPWIPSGETRARALAKWQLRHMALRRNTGNQDLPIGQFALYRLRFSLAGDLAGVWAEYGGIVSQINNLAVALDLSITDRPGIDVTCDCRMRRAIQKIATTRSTKTGYFELLSNLNEDVRAG